jgi:hypothetical protein
MKERKAPGSRDRIQALLRLGVSCGLWVLYEPSP